jgi:serine/threonine protein phosphatase PrpC
VWLKDKEMPGLAMTRSMADSCGAQAGVSGIPDLVDFTIDSKDDKYIVIGSDGVWEFISNEQAGSIVLPFSQHKNAEGAGESLVKASYLAWKEHAETQIDDITTVILFLK